MSRQTFPIRFDHKRIQSQIFFSLIWDCCVFCVYSLIMGSVKVVVIAS